MLGSLILYLKGMRTTMFQLSGFYCRRSGFRGLIGGFRLSGVHGSGAYGLNRG